MVIKVKRDARVINQGLAIGAGLMLQGEGNRERLQDAEQDGEIARVLRDLAAAEFAFFLQALEIRPGHGHQLQNDGGGDVGHDAQGEDGQPAEIAAAEQVDDAQHRSLILLEELGEHVGIDARGGQESAQAVDSQHSQRKQDPLAQIRDAKHVGKGLRKIGS